MRVIKKRRLNLFGRINKDVDSQLQKWYKKVKSKDERWEGSEDALRLCNKVNGDRAIIEICNNRYRLTIKISYYDGIIFIGDLLTHKEYDSFKPNIWEGYKWK